jgi:hypothetical protein
MIVKNNTLTFSDKRLYQPYPSMVRPSVLFFTPAWKTFTELTATTIDSNNVMPVKVSEVVKISESPKIVTSIGKYSFSIPLSKETFTFKTYIDEASYQKVKSMEYLNFRLLIQDLNNIVYSKISDSLVYSGVNCQIIRVYRPMLVNGIDVQFTEIDIEISEQFNSSVEVLSITNTNNNYNEDVEGGLITILGVNLITIDNKYLNLI